MPSKSKFAILLLIITISCCTESAHYIIPVDFAAYEKEYLPGLKQEEIQKIQNRQWEELQEKTIGKELPDLIIIDTANSKINLRSLINDKTLLVLTGAHCGWGMEGLTNDLPYALKKLKEENIEIDVICLFKKSASDDDNIANFITEYNVLKSFYPGIYIISEKESNKLNAFANPTRLLIGKDKSIINIGIGVSTPEILYEILKNELLAT